MALLDNLGNLGTIGNIISAATNSDTKSGDSASGTKSNGGTSGGGLNLSDLQSLAGLAGGLNLETLQKNPQMIQLLAKAIGAANAPEENVLKTMGDAVKTITTKAPAAEVSSELKEVAAEADKTSAGFWTKLQGYLGNADKLTKFIPLATKYAPKAVETLKGMAGNLLK